MGSGDRLAQIRHSSFMIFFQDRLVGGKIGKALPLTVFGATCVFAGLLLFILPETAGRELPGTIQDGIDFGRLVSFYVLVFFYFALSSCPLG